MVDIEPLCLTLALQELFSSGIPLHGLAVVIGQVYQMANGDRARSDFHIGDGAGAVSHTIQEVLLMIR